MHGPDIEGRAMDLDLNIDEVFFLRLMSNYLKWSDCTMTLPAGQPGPYLSINPPHFPQP